ncbi:MAG TPA: hypothetical protein VF525_04825 [Pyrinomonadaceae bacterium]
MSDNTIKIIAAAIPGVVSLIVACITWVSTKRNQVELEAFRSELAEERAERDAVRDYKYEARKRLYQEIEPLNFQLIEAAENALHRIYGLARTAQAGNLGAGGWLAREGYYTLSTMYKLIMPVAIFRLIQQKLTLVDLTVDPNANAQYVLAKALYISFTDDFVFASATPALPYDPNRLDWQERRAEDEQKYWRQGIPLGHLDDAADALLKHDGSGRWLTFGGFQRQYKDRQSEVFEKFDAVNSVLLNFHPRTRPVLWRLLVTQAHLYLALLQFRHAHAAQAAARPFAPLRLIPPADRACFDWRHRPDEASDQAVLVKPFDVAQHYLHQRVSEFFAREEQTNAIAIG